MFPFCRNIIAYFLGEGRTKEKREQVAQKFTLRCEETTCNPQPTFNGSLQYLLKSRKLVSPDSDSW